MKAKIIKCFLTLVGMSGVLLVMNEGKSPWFPSLNVFGLLLIFAVAIYINRRS